MSFAHHFWERKAFVAPMCVSLRLIASLCNIGTFIEASVRDDCDDAAAAKTLAFDGRMAMRKRSC